jgi:hypothetical protein
MGGRRANFEQFLADVPHEVSFWCNNGQNLKNLAELSTALQAMNSETFAHHVNKERNDFHNWVKEVIGDTKLANDLKRACTQEQATKVVLQRLIYLR